MARGAMPDTQATARPSHLDGRCDARRRLRWQRASRIVSNGFCQTLTSADAKRRQCRGHRFVYWRWIAVCAWRYPYRSNLCLRSAILVQMVENVIDASELVLNRTYRAEDGYHDH